MTQLTLTDLTQIASEFLRDEYGLALEIPIKRNNRFSRVLGRVIFDHEWTPERIEISGELFKYGADEAIIDTLKHELVHYALCVKGEPFDDGHPHFEAELKRLSISSTEQTSLGPSAVYSCDKCRKIQYACNKRYVKALEKSTQGFTTRCCGATLTYIKTEIFDGTRSVEECLKSVS